MVFRPGRQNRYERLVGHRRFVGTGHHQMAEPLVQRIEHRLSQRRDESAGVVRTGKGDACGRPGQKLRIQERMGHLERLERVQQ